MAKIFALTLSILGCSLSLPLAVAFLFDETHTLKAFALPMASSLVIAGALLFFARGKSVKKMEIKDAFSAVGGVWLMACIIGAAVYLLSGSFDSFADALFESVSGFTTTGASIAPDVESLPKSVNFFRCFTHWLGGMGIIALLVALTPLLGIGGFHLIKAETTGPEKGKITTRITNTAKVLWFIYCGFTLLETMLLNFSGLSWYDAVCHSFSTVSTGGFSTRNASISAFSNAGVEWICIIFMFLASINFSLYFYAFSSRKRDILLNSELKAFILLSVGAALTVTALRTESLDGFASTMRSSFFQTFSIISSTGFMSEDYCTWNAAAQAVILALFFIGGCSCSTAGGVKVIRWTILFKQLLLEFRKILHPHGIYTLRINGQPGRESLVQSVASFIFLYLLLVALTMLAGGISGLPVTESLINSLTMVGNIGPSFGDYGPAKTYTALPTQLKYIYSFAMLAGRLELYTMMILAGRIFMLRRSGQ